MPLLGIVIAAGVGCAGRPAGPPESNDRIAELEARIARLEGVLAPDASVTGPEVSADAGQTEVVKRTVRVELDATAPPDPRAIEEACLEQIERTCSRHAMHQRAGAAHEQGGGRQWVKRELLPARDTPEGRACLAREQKGCAARSDQAKERAKHFAWLDAQLAPGKLDAAYTDALRARLGQEGYPNVDVRCAPQFCRFGTPTSAPDGGGAGFSHEMMRWMHELDRPSTGSTSSQDYGGATYVTRSGYDFPR